MIELETAQSVGVFENQIQDGRRCALDGAAPLRMQQMRGLPGTKVQASQCMEKARQHVASIAEHNLDVQVSGGLHNAGHEAWCCQIYSHLHHPPSSIQIIMLSAGGMHLAFCPASQYATVLQKNASTTGSGDSQAMVQ